MPSSFYHKSTPLENNALSGSIMCRNPYIDPLHITQVELMRGLREYDKDEGPLLEHGLCNLHPCASTGRSIYY